MLLHLIVPLPSWTRPGTPLSHRPAAADGRTPPAGDAPDTVTPWEIRSARPLFTPPPRFPADPETGTARPVRAVPPRSAGSPDSREEGSGARTPRATGPLHAKPSAQRPASKAHDCALPAGYPAGTCHRPPVDLHRQRAQALFTRRDRVNQHALTGRHCGLIGPASPHWPASGPQTVVAAVW